MSAHVYDSASTWPTHSRAYWNPVLTAARAAGWTLNYLDAPHRFGVVACPAGAEAGGHTFVVDKTSVGAERFAKLAAQKIRRCRHGAASTSAADTDARAHEAERLLTRAAELVRSAAAGIAAAESQQAAFADLDAVEIMLETASGNLHALLLAQDAALERAVSLDEAAPFERLTEEVDEAAEHVESAHDVVRRLRARVAAPMLVRAQEISVSIVGLRRRLAAL